MFGHRKSEGAAAGWGSSLAMGVTTGALKAVIGRGLLFYKLVYCVGGLFDDEL